MTWFGIKINVHTTTTTTAITQKQINTCTCNLVEYMCTQKKKMKLGEEE